MEIPDAILPARNALNVRLKSVILKSWKWLVVVAAYSFLSYKLVVFDQYPAFFREISLALTTNYGWLAGVFLLLPFNWLLESQKWRLLVQRIEPLSLKNAFLAFLAGISTGFFTPNRVGELVGRVMYLKPENRKAGATLSLVNSLTQNMIMALGGIPATLIFFTGRYNSFAAQVAGYLWLVAVGLVLLTLFFFMLPGLGKRWNRSSRISAYVSFLRDYTVAELLRVLWVGAIRYGVFCTQFYFMLRFFGVDISLAEAFIAIPTTYLFVSFTPSFSFSEAAVRSSYAVLFVGAFYSGEVAIILSGVSIWIVNFVLPMLAGSLLMVRRQ